jgi:ATP-binding cassette subfamily B protein
MTTETGPHRAYSWSLLPLMRLATRKSTITILVTGTVLAIAPLVEALASGWLFRAVLRLDTEGDAAIGAVAFSGAALGLTLIVSTAGRTIDDAMRRAAAREIDGAVRDQVRAAALTPIRFDHLHDPSFCDDLAHAGDLGMALDGRRSLGAATVGQVQITFRVLVSLAAAAVWATLSVFGALAMLGLVLGTRAMLHRQWIPVVADEDDPRQRRFQHMWSDLATDPAAAKEIRIYGLNDWIRRRYQSHAFRAAAARWRRLGAVLRAQWTVVLLTALSMAIPLGILAYQVMVDHLPANEVVFYLVAAQPLLALTALGQETYDVVYGGGRLPAYRRIAATRTTPRVVPDQSRTHDRPVPDVLIDDVDFAYPNTPTSTLSATTLHIRSGEVLGLVGLNGAGKTTITRLIAGLYTPTRGRVVIDGVDLAELDPDDWRRRMTVMSQGFARYPASLADNVALSAPEHADDRDGVRAALHRAGADNLLSALPDGLDTRLWRTGTGGTDLSGGQWQRIAIARMYFALEHGRRLLILDEPTAHLDVHAEIEFFDRLVAATEGATTILISHRLGTIRAADRIALLADGRIAEQGGHDSLLELNGAYARLFRLQASQFFPDEPVQASAEGVGPLR